MSQDAPLNSPLRWAGSKRKLLPSILAVLPENFDRYVEPFCGSLSLYLSLPKCPAMVSDINEELIHFYRMVRWRSNVVGGLARAWDRKPETYYKVRSLVASELGAEARAARFLYLNRLCFNGVYRTNSRGEFNVPRGDKVPDMPESTELNRLAAKLKNADLQCRDFSETLAQAGRGDFVYLDPPYAGRGVRNRGEYGLGSFSISDLGRFTSSVNGAASRGAKILISYADVEVIHKAFSGWNLRELVVPRSVSGFSNGRGVAKEVFLLNY